ncbi:hypothetical protein HMPREF9012_1758 [Bacteroidetes bacterium oral taxon 272 str. F0290]|nr:hypothetical protein HMPREF9012_1758 [Bacteroidetes bacterium oral taxon 272 str. F0290]
MKKWCKESDILFIEGFGALKINILLFSGHIFCILQPNRYLCVNIHQ